MSEVLDQFPEWATGRRRAKADYQQWLDGRIHLLHPGDDFPDGDTDNFVRRFKMWCRRHGIDAVIQSSPAEWGLPRTVVVKAEARR